MQFDKQHLYSVGCIGVVVFIIYIENWVKLIIQNLDFDTGTSKTMSLKMIKVSKSEVKCNNVTPCGVSA
ncbi:MAG: hypothetical protein PHI32_04060 [Dysgonamonadaceae bacterium]|nr:hypothetical protein [Dysgonamonadaceae bacterium]MDD4728732.1 hypothetical protein [Dysgonamonadaceae bacterium]